MKKRIFALTLMLILSVVSTMYFVKYLENKPNLDPLNEISTVNDNSIYETLDLAVYKVEGFLESGTGFLIKENKETNTLYLMTNAHVVDAQPNDRYFKIKQPHIDTDIKLCGQTIATSSSVDIDVAIIEIKHITTTTCDIGAMKSLNLNTYSNYRVLSIAKSNSDIYNQYYYSVGYPLSIYRRDKFRFTGIYNKSAFVIDGIKWRYEHYNFNYNTHAGSSGSPIVTQDLEVFAILSTNKGGVSYNSINTAIKDLNF